MEAFASDDASCFQGGSNTEASAQSATRSNAVIRIEIVENANEILGPTMAQNQHENYKCNLWKSATSLEWRLGIRKW